MKSFRKVPIGQFSAIPSERVITHFQLMKHELINLRGMVDEAISR